MPLSLANFVQTTLAAPITPDSLSIILTDPARFNLTEGDYCYLTIIDGSTVEIVKYTSAGMVVANTISVTRGQDGTTAKAFPAGACVKMAWNYQQMRDLVEAVYAALFDTSVLPDDTMLTEGAPSAPPAGNVIYAVDVSKKRLWYWDVNGPSWVELGNARDSVIVSNSAPTEAPADNVVFCIVPSTAALYFWNGSAWLKIAGGSTGHEIWTKQSVSGATGPGAAGATLNLLDPGLTIESGLMWRENEAQASILSVNGSNHVVFGHDCLMRAHVQCGIGCPLPIGENEGTVGITVQAQGRTWAFNAGYSTDAGDSQSNKSLSVGSPIMQVDAGDELLGFAIFDSSSAQTMTVSDTIIQVEVLALL